MSAGGSHERRLRTSQESLEIPHCPQSGQWQRGPAGRRRDESHLQLARTVRGTEVSHGGPRKVSDSEQDSKKLNTRGWAKITLGSSRLSNAGLMRRGIERLFKPWPDTQPCMWEI